MSDPGRAPMKRYAVLVTADYGWSVHAECDTLTEAAVKREEAIGYCHPIIVEVIPPIYAYAMAYRETEAQQLTLKETP
jgi:hypothetical protein